MPRVASLGFRGCNVVGRLVAGGGAAMLRTFVYYTIARGAAAHGGNLYNFLGVGDYFDF